MQTEASTLRMLRLRLSLPHLFELGRRRRLPLHETDEGYLVHCQLRELFGEQAPQPFAVQAGNRRTLDVLGYSTVALAELRAHADAFADPAVHAACDWNQAVEKHMPPAWAPGRRFGFSLRACPVVRMSSDGPRHRKGAEVDAYLARCWAMAGSDAPPRELVYVEWLRAQVGRRGGAHVVSAGLTGFKRNRLVRRTQGAERRARIQERPDVMLHGELEVTDAEEFASLLRQGIGRHRAFGFGMLLLRPASVAAC